MEYQSAPEQTSIRQCTGCGAAVEMSDAVLSAQCSYCEAPLVDGDRAAERIDRIAPFRITREVAQSKLEEYLSTKFWAPREIKAMTFGGAGLRGVLVPHWALSGIVRTQYRARVGIYWYRTEHYTDSEGNRKTRRKRETEWFNLSGSAARQVEDHLVSASSGLPEAESNWLEPFDLGWAVPFDPRLIAGFEAEVPSVAGHRAVGTAASELRSREAPRIERELLPGDSNKITNARSEVDVHHHDIVLLPVWIGSYHHKGKPRRVLVNGQTGLVCGDVPVSRVKVAVAICAAVLAVAAAVAIILVMR